MPPFLPFYYLCHFNPHKIMELLSYFYHPDHTSTWLSTGLGSSSWITDGSGQAIQHLHYLPFGEDWVDQRNSTWNTPYTFSGKEKDVETGYGYVKKLRFFSSLAFGNGKQVSHYTHCLRRFGARYYNSGLSIWLSVDPMSDKYPSMSPYNYCANNPVMIVDPDGRDYIEAPDRYDKSFRICVSNIAWVKSVDSYLSIPGIGSIFEVMLWSQRMYDPSLKANDGDYAGIALSAIGLSSMKMIKKISKIKGINNFLLQANYDLPSLVFGALNDPDTKEMVIDFLALKSLEAEGVGYIWCSDEKKSNEYVFVLNDKYTVKIKKEILSNKKLTSSKGFNLEKEMEKRIAKIMDNKKIEIRNALENGNKKK